MGREELEDLFLGYGYTPRFVEGSEPQRMHGAMAEAMDEAFDGIAAQMNDTVDAGDGVPNSR